jgi:hypothetical protein
MRTRLVAPIAAVTQSSPVIAVKSAGLLLYFTRTKENQVVANEKIMTQQKDRRKKRKLGIMPL